MSTAIDPGPVRRFSEALDRLNPSRERIGLAVSGGPDSLAMLLLAHEAIPGAFAVATVDHGLRPEAADECALVQRACAERAIPCDVLRVRVGEGNLQQEARSARYAALAEWADRKGLAAVATAHHADDQAETLLMRLNRGSGVAGLAGVRQAQRHEALGLTVIRPLLGFRRAELAAIVRDEQVAQDPSNADPRYDRVRIRQALAGADWLDPEAIGRSAANLAEAYAALQDYAALLWPQAVQETNDGFAFTPVASREINRRLVALILERIGRKRPRGGDVARLLERLESGEGGNVAGVLGQVRGGIWRFAPEPPRAG